VDPRSGIITVREFHDTGLPKQTGTYQPCRTDRCEERTQKGICRP
jgi:hypothetical protein